ncbi:MAG: hypothetical protein QOJ72_2254 [Nocardioidaceae bacterium]|jgi:hypothetical protein|nr:hypothetical protein [Nocardioidaceae bacterium]
MTWDAYNRRKEVLREMLDVADRHPDTITLTDLLDTVDGGREAFANETELLFDIQMTWFQRLSGQLDRLVTEGADTPEIVAITAWVNAAGEMPGARALLDANSDTTALRKAYAKEHALLAASAGVPVNHPDLTAHGQRLQDSARESVALSHLAA